MAGGRLQVIRVGKVPIFTGKIVSWTDFVVGAHFLSWRTVLGVDSKGWKEVEKWNGGRWCTLVNNSEKYQTVRQSLFYSTMLDEKISISSCFS